MLNRNKKFKGGYIFRKPEGVFNSTIKESLIPSKVTIPLKLRFGSTITPLVKKGDKVYAGQILAYDDETISCPAIASVNGIVEDICRINYYYGKVDAVVVKSDGSSGCQPLEGAREDFEKLSYKEISELIYLSGSASLGKSGIPTIKKSSPARPKSIDDLIITSFGTGPFALDKKVILRSREKDFYKGLEILKKALPNLQKVSIAMDKRDKVFIREVMDVIRLGSPRTNISDRIFIEPLEKKYPQESEDMLVRTILNKKIPIGGLGTDIGVLILEAHDVLSVYDAVALGKPCIERTVALSGPACKENRYINVRNGTPLKEVLKGNLKDDVEPRVLFGNAMTGLWQRDLSIPVGRSIGHITVLEENKKREFIAFMKPGLKHDSYSNTFLSSYLPFSRRKYDTNMHGELRPCIQCGWCEEVCPVHVIPHLLSKQISHDICENTEQMGIFECIDCGLCSYVCPSKISLADIIIKGKRKLIEEGCLVPRVKVKESEEAVKAYRGRMPL